MYIKWVKIHHNIIQHPKHLLCCIFIEEITLNIYRLVLSMKGQNYHFCNILDISIMLIQFYLSDSFITKQYRINWAGKYIFPPELLFFLENKNIRDRCETFTTGREFRDHQVQFPVFMGEKMDVQKGGMRELMVETRIRTQLFWSHIHLFFYCLRVVRT